MEWSLKMPIREKEFLEPVFIDAFDLDDAWFQCLAEILEHGYVYTITRGSYEGQKRLEFDFVTVRVRKPAHQIIPIIPEGMSIPAPTDMEYILHALDYLEAREKVMRIYKTQGPGTNQATMEIGMPSDIKLNDPPCLRIIDTRVRYGKLHFILYFRSWDLWGGFPSNLGGLQLVKQYMAEEIGVKDGEIIAVSKGLHLYDYSWGLAKMRTNKLNLQLEGDKA